MSKINHRHIVPADRVDQLFAQIAKNALNYRWLVISLFSVLCLGSLYFAGTVKMDNSMNAYFNQDDPTFVAYQQYLEDFSSDEQTYILYRVPGKKHGPFDYEVMQKIAKLTAELEDKVPFTSEVTSLSNVEFMWAEGDDLFVDELLVDFPQSQEALLAVRERLTNKPLYMNYLIDESLEYAAIVIEMNRTSTDSLERLVLDPEKGTGMDNLYPQVTDHAVRDVLANPEYAEIEFFLSGDTIMNTTYNEILGIESVVGLLMTLGLVMLVSFFLFNATAVGLMGPVTVVVLSLISTTGFIGLLGWDIGLMFALVPTLLCAVGVAQSVHILLEFQRKMDETGSRKTSAIEAIRKVGGPCMMAALTTAAGFAVMTISELKALSQLGVYSAVGVLLTFALSMSLLVVFLGTTRKSNTTKKSIKVHPKINYLVEKCTDACLNKGKTIIIVSGMISLIAIIGLSRLTIDFNFLTEFKPHVEFRQHTEIAEDVMGGMLSLTYGIDTNKNNGMKNPELLQAMDKFQTYAEETHPLIKKSFSLTNVIKDLNKSLNQDQPDYYTIPSSSDLIAQYLLLYEISGGEEKDELVTNDYQRGVIELRVGITDSSNIELLLQDLDGYLKMNPIPGAEISRTGIGLMWVKMGDYISDTQLYSYALIFVMVALFMCITFGSFKVGMLSMIPNLAPVVLALGMMGWLAVPLDYMKLLLATIAIGIAVDDTIHLVTRFRSRFMETGNYETALRASMQDVGPALIITSIILIVSFMSFLISSTTSLASFGVLLGSTIFIALMSDLLTLPALFMWLKPFGPETNTTHPTTEKGSPNLAS